MIFAALNVFIALGISAKSFLARFWIGAAAALALAYLNVAVGALVFEPQDPWPGLRHLLVLGAAAPAIAMVGVPLVAWAAGGLQRRGRQLPGLEQASQLFLLLAGIFTVELCLAWLID